MSRLPFAQVWANLAFLQAARDPVRIAKFSDVDYPALPNCVHCKRAIEDCYEQHSASCGWPNAIVNATEAKNCCATCGGGFGVDGQQIKLAGATGWICLSCWRVVQETRIVTKETYDD